jgi:hypothetical protein
MSSRVTTGVASAATSAGDPAANRASSRCAFSSGARHAAGSRRAAAIVSASGRSRFVCRAVGRDQRGAVGIGGVVLRGLPGQQVEPRAFGQPVGREPVPRAERAQASAAFRWHPQLLAAALQAVGYLRVEVHESPQQLRGWGGQSAGAEVIVRREHATGHTYGDFGFARGADGAFEAVIDDLDRARNGSSWLPSLTRAYGHAAALKYAKDHGYEVVTDEEERDGTRRLTLRRHT